MNIFTKRQIKFSNKAKCYGHNSRKAKKAMLGFRLSKNKIKRLLQQSTVEGGYLDTTIEPYAFCPVCGCTAIRWFNHGVAYPERWETGICARCGQKVCESDNSPYVHILEWILGEDKTPLKEAIEHF